MAYEIDAVREWLKSMGAKGIYGATSARLRTTAVEQLTGVLGSDEPRDVESVLANIKAIANRWATKNQANPETAATYLSKAKSTLEAFLRYQQSPTNFSVATKAERSGEGRKPKARPSKSATEPTTAAPPSPTYSSIPAGLRDYPMSSGSIFYKVPEGGFTSRDTLKFALHLLTYASDFDPQAQAQMFALVRKAEAA
jgi:hypothetical protein